jgi:hypothetical protein
MNHLPFGEHFGACIHQAAAIMWGKFRWLMFICISQIADEIGW